MFLLSSLSLLFPFLWLFCSIVVINTSLFCSVWHLLCIIMFSVFLQLFLCHFCCCCCCYCCCFVAVFSLSLLMLLLLLVVFCCCCRCCCMGVAVFNVVGVRMVAGVVVVVIVIAMLLLPVLHRCFVLFYGFLISLSLSSH